MHTTVSVAEYEKAREEAGINPKLLSLIVNIEQWFWSQRWEESRNWNWIVVVTRCFFQTNSLLNPRSDSYFTVNCWYMVLNVAMVAMQVASYRSVHKEALVFIVLCLGGIRLSFRFLDFEKVKPLRDSPDDPINLPIEEWETIVMLNYVMSFVCLFQMS